MNNFEVTIDRIEDDKVVVKTQQNETVVLPISWLPKGMKEGDVCYFSIKNLQDKGKAGREQAKDILNEILDTTE